MNDNRLTSEDREELIDAVASGTEVEWVEQILARHVADLEAQVAHWKSHAGDADFLSQRLAEANEKADYWKVQAEGFMRSAVADLGRYHQQLERAERAEAALAAAEARAGEAGAVALEEAAGDLWKYMQSAQDQARVYTDLHRRAASLRAEAGDHR